MGENQDGDASFGVFSKSSLQTRLTTRGPSGIAIMLGGLGVMALGWTQIISWNRKARDLGREQAVARLSLLPLLQAEQDRINMKKMKDNLEMERLIMADVPDWEVGKSVYYTERWVHPKTIQ